MKKVSAAQAKAGFSALMAEVAHGGKHILIERRGEPYAALVSVADLERLAQEKAPSAQPHGALALVGAWKDVADEELEELVSGIYAARVQDTGRPVNTGA